MSGHTADGVWRQRDLGGCDVTCDASMSYGGADTTTALAASAPVLTM